MTIFQTFIYFYESILLVKALAILIYFYFIFFSFIEPIYSFQKNHFNVTAK